MWIPLVRAGLVVCALSGMVGGYANAAEPAMAAHSAKGDIFVDAKGMTLYTYTKDKGEQSVCYGKCAKAWPPLAAPANATGSGEWSVITRKDGTKQWAYRGKPLYTFVKDKKPGETAGEGFHNVWYVAKP